MKTDTLFLVGGCAGSSPATSANRVQWDTNEPWCVRRKTFLRLLYGGDTTSFLLRHKKTIVIVDQGMGIISLSDVVKAMLTTEEISEVHVAHTHFHLDHVHGIPFNGLYFHPGLRIITHSPDLSPWRAGTETFTGEGPYLQRLIPRYFNPQSGLWPVPFAALQATLEHREFVPGATFKIGDVEVSTLPLPHPNGCCGYGLNVPGVGRIVIATDHEPKEEPDPDVVEFFNGSRLLIADMQYDDAEFAGTKAIGGRMVSRVDWGHGRPGSLFPPILKCTARPQRVRIVHHDPLKCDTDLHSFYQHSHDVLCRMNGSSAPPFDYEFAHDGDVEWL